MLEFEQVDLVGWNEWLDSGWIVYGRIEEFGLRNRTGCNGTD